MEDGGALTVRDSSSAAVFLTHVWMVRTFLKHSEELEEDEDLGDVHRTLYDYMHALGTAWKAQDAEAYLKQARKKIAKLRGATDQFAQLQPSCPLLITDLKAGDIQDQP